jgi:LAO/AO transport system kinase
MSAIATAASAGYQRSMPSAKKTPSAPDLSDIAGLVARMRAGERRALSRVVTELERFSEAAPRLLHALEPHLGSALVVGFTGPPGAGKSTLVNAYTAHARRAGQSVGIIAVDPSSPISGGAILGDRIRMTTTLDDDGVFMRSLASRGHSGGLCPAAVRVIDALDAAGKELILIETVGTGQSEIDVAEIADVRVLVTAPGLGDDIQAMKAGLIDVVDVVVVNKADCAGADRTAHQLRHALYLRARASCEVPVLKTTAATGEGLDALERAVVEIAASRGAEGARERRRRRARYLIAHAAAERLARRVKASGGGRLDALADAVLSGTVSAEDAAARLLED